MKGRISQTSVNEITKALSQYEGRLAVATKPENGVNADQVRHENREELRAVIASVGKEDPEVIAARKVIDKIAGVCRLMVDIDRDKSGKIEIDEYGMAGVSLFPMLIGSFGPVKEVADKWKEFDAKEVELLLAYASTLEFMPNQKAQVNIIIQRVLAAVSYNASFIRDMINVFKKDV